MKRSYFKTYMARKAKAEKKATTRYPPDTHVIYGDVSTGFRVGRRGRIVASGFDTREEAQDWINAHAS